MTSAQLYTRRTLTRHRKSSNSGSLQLEKQRKLIESNTERKTRLSIIEQAVKEIEDVKSDNDGQLLYGDSIAIIKKYNEMGYTFVTKNSIYYHMKTKKEKSNSIDIDIPADVTNEPQVVVAEVEIQKKNCDCTSRS